MYSVSNICGTKDTFQVVTVESIPAPYINGVGIVCLGHGFDTLYGNPLGGTWTSSNTGLATVTTAGYVSAVDTGTVMISYTVTNACGTGVATEQVKVLNSICNDAVKMVNAADEGIKVYPNPSEGQFTVELPYSGSKTTVMITDVYGKIVETTELENNSSLKLNYDMKNVARGTYLIKVIMDNKTYREKLVIW